MGCMFGCDEHDDDDRIHTRNHHHHHRSDRRVAPYYGYCHNCRCEGYTQQQQGSSRCYCGHKADEHKRI
jgi:hypothetical protein